jgi:short subunit dehydrogenase-like uncharacterized protein
MATESALSLIHDAEHLPQTYGVLTPSVAFGTPLLMRLQQKGISFSIEK